MKTIIAGTVLALTLLAGCARSLFPLFAEKDLVFNPSLVGRWMDPKSSDGWTFSKSGDRSYSLVHFQAKYGPTAQKVPGDTARFEARLGRLGQYWFLDITPSEQPNGIKNDFLDFHLLPVHSFWRIWFENDSLRLAMLDNDWLKNMIDSSRVSIKHEEVRGGIVLTAPTEELQPFVLKYAEDAQAFPEPGTLRRVM